MDHLVLNQLRDELLGYVKETTPKKLLINFGSVRSCSIEAVDGLTQVRDSVVGNDGQLKISDMRKRIRRNFGRTLVEPLFDFYDAMPDALDDFEVA